MFLPDYRSILLIILLLFFLSCKKNDEPEVIIPINPVAGFTFTGGDKPAPHKVYFTNTSTDANYYLWDFGDEGYSTATHPEHIYQQGGIFTITLIAQNGNLQDTISKSVTVLNRPTKVQMNLLALTAFPATDNGADWDADSPPDIFFDISNYGGSVFYTSAVIHDILTNQLPVTYTEGMPHTFTTLDSNYYLRFYENDSFGTNEVMGIFSFPLNLWVPDDGSGYPSELSLQSNTDLKFTLSVEWLN